MESNLTNLELILNASSDAIFVLDGELRIHFWNQGAVEFLGYPKDQMIGQSATLLIPQAKSEDHPFNHHSQISSHQMDTVLLTKEGLSVDTCISISPILEGDSVRLGSIIIARNIGNQKKVQNELKDAQMIAENANRAKSDFLANMSHEIRTPLNGIIGFTDLLLKTQLDHTQKDYMRTVFQSASLLLDIVNDILDFSKIEAGKLELVEEMTSLGDLADEVINVVRYGANQKGIKLRLDVSHELPDFVYVDPMRIRQVLVNLISNAIKFTEVGKVELSIQVLEKISDDKMKIRLSIRDTGIGIAKESQDKIFFAFTQEDFSITRKFGGTGLGLAISNQLLERMNSKLQLKSEIGKGSDFYFDLELNVSESSFLDFNPEPRKHNFQIGKPFFTNDKISILVAEDNPVNMMLVKAILGRIAPHAVITEARNGLEAVILVKSKIPDIIFMDVQMPVLNGYEATMEIREITGAKLLPIIAVTAGTVLGEKERCLEAGMNDYISKPALKADFERMMKLWLK